MKLLAFLLILFQTFIVHEACAEKYQTITAPSVQILFPQGLENAAKEVAELYPVIKHDLENLFKWPIYSGVTVLLVADRNHFTKMSGGPLIVAFAVPEKKLIVLDYSRIIKRPFNLKTTLKHEFCHILLHTHISGEILPRWLDEGLCQWASGGIDEIIYHPGRSRLTRATLTNRFIRLRDLWDRFPASDDSLILAYEQSKSFVTYLFSRFGKKQVLSVLAKMESGEQLSIAMETIFSASLENIEADWQRSIKIKTSWFMMLTSYLYEFLFVTMALITIIAFIRYRFRKKSMYMEDDDFGEY